MQQIKKAVFPVAGMGSRFLPATKATPKEMLPIVDKPLIQYAVEEALNAGVTELIFVTSSSKRTIEDHFDFNYELEARLAEQNKNDLLEIVQNVLPKNINCIYIRQPFPLGLGHAVLCAEPAIGNEPFAVLLADDLIDDQHHQPCLQQMVAAYDQYQSHIIAVQKVPSVDLNKYGIVAIDYSEQLLEQIHDIVEKPTANEAPSNFGAIGRYILNASIFSHLKQTPKGKGGEIQLTDGIRNSLHHEHAYAFKFQGKRYDCGSKLGYIQATITYALKHPECKDELKDFLMTLCAN